MRYGVVISVNWRNAGILEVMCPAIIRYLVENTVSIQNTGSEVVDFQLKQNYPNPFNPETNISFSLPRQGYTTLKVYDALGRIVSVLLQQRLNAGTHNLTFDASELRSGVYFYRIETEGFTAVKRMILIK